MEKHGGKEKRIPEGFEPINVPKYSHYYINKKGEIYATTRSVFVKTFLGSRGYMVVNLFSCAVRKHLYIHRLLALTFIKNEHGYRIINHIDGNPLNNDLSNLEWCEQKHNVFEARRLELRKPKISVTEVSEIRYLLTTNLYYQYTIAEIYGVCQSTVSVINLGISRSYVKDLKIHPTLTAARQRAHP